MGSTLTGQKIKDTYLGFIKTSDSLEVTASGKELTDGNGNDLNVFINTAGEIGFGSTPDYTIDAGSSTGAFRLPNGSTAQQPTGQTGLIRYNTTDSKLEYYDSSFKFIASENYVNTQINNLIDSSPAALDTLNEIAAALNDDPDFYNTITNLINAKQDTITGAATTIVSSDLTVSRALISNGSGKVAVSTVTDTELGYLSGTTSAVQTQIDSKQNTLTAGAGIDITSDTISTNLSNLVDTGAIQNDAVTAIKIAQFDDNLSAATGGDILVSDGTDFTNVTVSGDITISSLGVTTIGADKIDGTNIVDDSIDSEHYVAGSIDEEHLNATNSPTDNYVLSYDQTSGGFTWIASSGGGATNLVIDTGSGDGTTVAFTLSNTILNENNVQVYIDGVYQSKSNYSTATNVVTFTTAPANGASIEFTHVVSLSGTPNVEIDNFSGDGSTTSFTLTSEPASKNNLQIYIDGVYQAKANYSVTTTTLTFTTAPATGTNNIEVTHLKIS